MLRVIEMKWEGPYSCQTVIDQMKDGGTEENGWGGEDYGLYQIYGEHILVRGDTLLYVGQASDQTFSDRFKQHKKDWIYGEPNVKIYLGRIVSAADDAHWKTWQMDLDMAEAILVYKYTPNYNSRLKQTNPDLHGFSEVNLVHQGKIGKISPVDLAPKEYAYAKISE